MRRSKLILRFGVGSASCSYFPPKYFLGSGCSEPSRVVGYIMMYCVSSPQLPRRS